MDALVRGEGQVSCGASHETPYHINRILLNYHYVFLAHPGNALFATQNLELGCILRSPHPAVQVAITMHTRGELGHAAGQPPAIRAVFGFFILSSPPPFPRPPSLAPPLSSPPESLL